MKWNDEAIICKQSKMSNQIASFMFFTKYMCSNSAFANYMIRFHPQQFDSAQFKKSCERLVMRGEYLQLLSSLLTLFVFHDTIPEEERKAAFAALDEIRVNDAYTLNDLLFICWNKSVNHDSIDAKSVVMSVMYVVCKKVLRLEKIPKHFTKAFVDELRSACWKTQYGQFAYAGLMSSVLLAYDCCFSKDKMTEDESQEAKKAFYYGMDDLLSLLNCSMSPESILVINELYACLDADLSPLFMIGYDKLNKTRFLELCASDTEIPKQHFAFLDCVKASDPALLKGYLSDMLSNYNVVETLLNNVDALCSMPEEYNKMYPGIGSRLIIYSVIFSYINSRFDDAEAILTTYYESLPSEYRRLPVVIYVVLQLLKRCDDLSRAENLKRMLNIESGYDLIGSAVDRMELCVCAMKYALISAAEMVRMRSNGTVHLQCCDKPGYETPLADSIENAFDQVFEAVDAEMEANGIPSVETFHHLHNIVRCCRMDGRAVDVRALKNLLSLPAELAGLDKIMILSSLFADYCDCDGKDFFYEAEQACKYYDYDEGLVLDAKLLASADLHLLKLKQNNAYKEYERVRKQGFYYEENDSDEITEWLYQKLETQASDFLKNFDGMTSEMFYKEASERLEKGQKAFCAQFNLGKGYDLFGALSTDLSEEIKKYLLTSEMVYAFLEEQGKQKGFEELDYSAALISLTKALEVILKEKMYVPMLDSVKTHLTNLTLGQQSKFIPTSFNLYQGTTNRNNAIKQFVTGTISDIVCKHSSLMDYCTLLLPAKSWNGIRLNKQTGTLFLDPWSRAGHFSDFGGDQIFDIDGLARYAGLELNVLFDDQQYTVEFKGKNDHLHNQLALAGALNYIRVNYRNPVAHTAIISRELMNNGRGYMIGEDAAQSQGDTAVLKLKENSKALIWVLLSILK